MSQIPVTDSEAQESTAPSNTAPSGSLTLGGRCFFKNAMVYRLPADFALSSLELEQLLRARPLLDCGPLEEMRNGWVICSPLGRTVHTVNGQHLIALGTHKKILPASAIREECAKRALRLAEEQGAPVGRRQKRELKEKVRAELLAKALVRTIVTRAWIDTVNGWLVVEASGAARAERLVSELRDVLGSFAVGLLEAEQAPSFTMASWLRAGGASHRLTLDTDLELQSPDKATVRYARHTLEGEDIKKHLAEGKVVTRLGLTWNDQIAFVLTGKLELKRIAFLALDTATEGEEKPEEPSAEELFDADLLLMSDSLSEMLEDLSEALGITGKPETSTAEEAPAAD